MRHAKIVNGIVDVISLTNPTGDGWVEVPDSVFAGFTDNGDGTFTAPAPPAPSTDPADYPLNPFQFFSFFDEIGLTEEAVDTAIDAVEPDMSMRRQHKRRFRHATLYRRDHPLLVSLVSAVGKTPAEIDTAWMQAKDLR